MIRIIIICKKMMEVGAHLLWPETCPFCQKVGWSEGCAKCRKKVERLKVKEPACMRCGKPVWKEEQEYCHDCVHTSHDYNKGVSLWMHRPPVSTSVYQFKYHNQRTYGTFYAKELVKCYADTIKAWKPDLIMPIPLYKKRKKKRGFNQSELLAVKLSKQLGILIDVKSLLRVRDTKAQKETKHQDRKKNIKGAFSVSKAFVPVKTVLLIDDIYTTGSTIDEAAKVLRRAGVQNIYFLTISIGQGY